MTIVEIPASLVVTVAIYAAGAYVIGVACGWLAPRWQDKPDAIDRLTAALWPAVALVGVFTSLAATYRFAAKRFPRPAKWAGRIWFAMTLPFRPWRLGHTLRMKEENEKSRLTPPAGL